MFFSSGNFKVAKVEVAVVDRLSQYLGLDLRISVDDKFLPKKTYNNYNYLPQIIVDRWNVLWKKREELFWIKKINSDKYPTISIIKEYLSGNITKEYISKIYKVLTKNCDFYGDQNEVKTVNGDELLIKGKEKFNL